MPGTYPEPLVLEDCGSLWSSEKSEGVPEKAWPPPPAPTSRDCKEEQLLDLDQASEAILLQD
jgi:hypothetical protein